MQLKFPVGLFVGCLLSLTAACGITDGEVAGITPPSEESNTVVASIDNVAFTAIGTSSVAVGHSADSFSFSARDLSGARIDINVTGVGKPGTYALSLDGQGDGTYIRGTASWGTAGAGGFGTITFTTLSLIRAIGTFTFFGGPIPGTSATGTKQVMSGAFDVSFGAQ